MILDIIGQQSRLDPERVRHQGRQRTALVAHAAHAQQTVATVARAHVHAVRDTHCHTWVGTGLTLVCVGFVSCPCDGDI
jgi:hypothetical protein